MPLSKSISREFSDPRQTFLETDNQDLTHESRWTPSQWQKNFTWLTASIIESSTVGRGRSENKTRRLVRLLQSSRRRSNRRSNTVSHYASLRPLDFDSTNNDCLARIGQVRGLLSRVSGTTAFVVAEVWSLVIRAIRKFLNADTTGKVGGRNCTESEQMRWHLLSVPEERLLALGHIAMTGYDDTFSQLTDVDMEFGMLIDENGASNSQSRSIRSFLVNATLSFGAALSINSTPSSTTIGPRSQRRSPIR